jgi:hypothetical protein
MYFQMRKINSKTMGNILNHTNIKERKIQSFTAQQHVPKTVLESNRKENFLDLR